MLRKDTETSWIEDCQKAFDKIKEYLSTPPILVLPELGRPLILYLSVLDGAFRCVLGQHDETGRKEQAIYYLCKKFTPYEERTLPKHTRVGGVGIGAILVSETSQHYLVSAKLRFLCTNNMSEYEAYILELNMAVDMNIQELLVISNLDFLMHQVQGEWPAKNSNIFPYLHHVKELRKRFTNIELQHVPRIQNEFVDALATLSSMIQHPDKNFIVPIPVRIHCQPAYYAHVDEKIDGKPWFHDIKEYLAKGEYPEHKNHTKKCKIFQSRLPQRRKLV
ncbi:uncharacterized protein [Nicotiana sylvestris]|uniref:uncharacterized protein n=1 Tax=Nicotiana sylvestris TaxID=4096 RepID=UPI00388C88A7